MPPRSTPTTDPDLFDTRAALLAALFAAETSLSAIDPILATHNARLNLKQARAIGALAGMRAVVRDVRGVMKMLAPSREAAALAGVAKKSARKAKPEAAAALECAAIALTHALAAGDGAQARARAGKAIRALIAQTARYRATLLNPRVAAEAAAEKARRAWRKAKHGRTARARHAWRKAEKDYRCTADALGDRWPKTVARAGDLTDRLTAALGIERDCNQLRARLKRQPDLAGGKPAMRKARQLLKKRMRRAARKADQLGKQAHRAP
jgi:hypothetical protein